MIEVLRTRADEITLSPEDYDLMALNWTLRNGKPWRKEGYLHKIVADRMGLKSKQITHIDQNPYNNYRSNLQATTRKKQPTYDVEIYNRLNIVATINMQDIELAKYRWVLQKTKPARYEDYGYIYMHYDIAERMGVDCDLVKQIRHKDNNPLNNQRNNLRFIY